MSHISIFSSALLFMLALTASGFAKSENSGSTPSQRDYQEVRTLQDTQFGSPDHSAPHSFSHSRSVKEPPPLDVDIMGGKEPATQKGTLKGSAPSSAPGGGGGSVPDQEDSKSQSAFSSKIKATKLEVPDYQQMVWARPNGQRSHLYDTELPFKDMLEKDGKIFSFIQKHGPIPDTFSSVGNQKSTFSPCFAFQYSQNGESKEGYACMGKEYKGDIKLPGGKVLKDIYALPIIEASSAEEFGAKAARFLADHQAAIQKAIQRSLKEDLGLTDAQVQQQIKVGKTIFAGSVGDVMRTEIILSAIQSLASLSDSRPGLIQKLPKTLNIQVQNLNKPN